MFRCCHMFGCIPCIFGWSPVCLDAPIYLNTPYVWVPPVWTPLCMVRCPHMLGHPLYVWIPPYVWLSPVCLDAPQIYGTSKGMRDIQTYGGVQTYRGHSRVWGAYGHMLSLTKHAFFWLYMYSRHPNIFQTYTGGIQTYGSVQTYRRHPNTRVPKLTGYPNIWGIQTYMGCIHLDTPICLDAPCIFDAPYIWMSLMFGCLLVSLDAPHMSPCMFGHPIHLGAPHMFG